MPDEPEFEDALLREASDPATPATRLEELYRTDANLSYLDPRRDPLLLAVRHNPSLPLSCLRDAQGRGYERQLLLWYNPGIALAMAAEAETWAQGASWSLRWVQHGRQRLSARQGLDRLTLATRIAPWASGRNLDEEAWEEGWDLPPARLTPEQREDIRTVARHFAHLFGLPWPDP